ncbi:MAG: Stp1/IreP family PP2C-type Ser/Thr phosphatase [Anaerobutyricum sp.]|nr:Stp1/IreP family PP2C-type Ser/Thr phosphatase [Eubacterium sp.]MDY6046714.1 Stp1/IreP family PP2C-type Ser/Thr phosphatase [Anaerobutyricum sp.]
MKSFGLTDIGKKRKINQDYLFFSDEAVGCFPNLYIVADGMGGHRAGDKASSYSVTRFVELARKTERELPFLSMEKILKQVNKEVFQLSQREEEYSGMGTTFVVATVVDKVVYVMNVGDSRLYYYDGKLKQVTMDHSLVEELVRAGELNRLESRNHPQKNIITKAVGVSETIQPDFFMLDIEEGEKILLCSDGLTNMVDDEKLEEIMSEPEELNQMAQECINEALFYGGLDNIAVVIAQYGNGR